MNENKQTFLTQCDAFYEYPELETILRGYKDFEPAIAALALGIDESMFSISEWSEALCVFFEEVPHNRISNLQTAVGYIVCCAESQAPMPIRPRLAEVVREMLQEFGFEGD